MKLLLYCCKTKPYLFKTLTFPDIIGKYYLYPNNKYLEDNLNGKIIGECDYELEEIKLTRYDYLDKIFYETDTLDYGTLLKKSCLEEYQIENYLKDNTGYAIRIKNLHIFDVPRDLSEYSKKVEHCKCDKCLEHCKHYYAKNNITHTTNTGCTKYTILYEAPQNMMYVFDLEEKEVLISIRPEWLCKILNGEKTIEVRKKVLKEMMK